jgi:hypothetical protein
LAQVLLRTHNLEAVEHVFIFLPKLLDVSLMVNLLQRPTERQRQKMISNITVKLQRAEREKRTYV